ncbi:MAG: manganese efflux pump MntP family protein, partial [Defluviitaleaceae bacterium]|nr:manganese efflux pump MntP family protein [Defluviitaleaceae bacterium]
LYFGIFQAGMPVIGYFLAMWFSDRIVRFGPYIAFVLLLFLGAKMILSSRKKDDCSCGCCENCSSVEDVRLTPTKMLPLAVATSIDALAVGVSFALLRINITLAVSLIGIVTLTLSTIGAKIGSFFGTKFKSKAEAIGGLILIGMGLKILIDHLIN